MVHIREGEVLGEEYSLDNLQKGGKVMKPSGVRKTNLAYERPSSGCLKPSDMATSDHASGKTHKV